MITKKYIFTLFWGSIFVVPTKEKTHLLHKSVPGECKTLFDLENNNKAIFSALNT